MEPNFSGLAAFTLDQLDTPTNITTGRVVDYFKINVSSLNSLIGSSYVPSGDFVQPLLDYVGSGFYSQLYICNYYGKQVLANLGASAYDWSEVREGDSTVRRVSKNELAKTFRGLSSDCQNNLRDSANMYKVTQAIPQSLVAYNNLLRFNRLDS